MTLIPHTRQALQARSVPAQAKRLLVAVSGGADSVALLVVLRQLAPRLKLQLKVVHVHHGLRAAEADADARFVRALARRLKLPCVVKRVCVGDVARARGISVEMAARAVRYDVLVDVARRWGARGGAVAIVTAHTADDQAETVMLRLARGAGPRGLAGIPPVRVTHGIRILRPLLGVWRREIAAYLHERRQPWREDGSNTDRAMLRNRVRHDVLPALAAALNPRVAEALVRTAELLREDDACMEDLARTALAEVASADGALDVARLRDRHRAVRRRVIRLWLAENGSDPEHLTFAQVDAVDALAGQSRGAGAVSLDGGERVVRRGGALRAARPAARAKDFAAFLELPGVTQIPEVGIVVCARQGTRILRKRGQVVGALPASVSLSWRKLGRRRLVLRAWRAGDRLSPLGMDGSQKLQDIFVNAKVPAEARHAIPILVCGRDVVWIPGHRLARGWEVSGPGARILEITVARADAVPTV